MDIHIYELLIISFLNVFELMFAHKNSYYFHRKTISIIATEQYSIYSIVKWFHVLPIKLILVHRLKVFQALLFNTNNSIHRHSFVYAVKLSKFYF